jgi:hypothetical protein
MKFNFLLSLALCLATFGSTVFSQNTHQFFGSTFKVNCDGTIDVDLATDVQIYKVWNGPNLIVELNNFTSAPDVIYDPFVGGKDFGCPVDPHENVYIQVFSSLQSQPFGLSISQELINNCPALGPREFRFRGSTFTVNCDGTLDVDLFHNVQIYKVFSGGQVIAELNNHDNSLPDVIYTPFVGGVDFGNPVQPGQNISVQVQSSCGIFTLDISDVLHENCPAFSSGNFFGNPNLTAVETASETKTLRAYPNPVSAELTLELPVIDGSYELSIYGSNGQLLESRPADSGRTTLDTNDLPAGLYFLKARHQDVEYTQKIQVLE